MWTFSAGKLSKKRQREMFATISATKGKFEKYFQLNREGEDMWILRQVSFVALSSHSVFSCFCPHLTFVCFGIGAPSITVPPFIKSYTAHLNSDSWTAVENVGATIGSEFCVRLDPFGRIQIMFCFGIKTKKCVLQGAEMHTTWEDW